MVASKTNTVVPCHSRSKKYNLIIARKKANAQKYHRELVVMYRSYAYHGSGSYCCNLTIHDHCGVSQSKLDNWLTRLVCVFQTVVLHGEILRPTIATK